jgi:hypothetical protein
MEVRDAVVMHATGGIEQFFEIEGLGVRCEPKCGSCKCGNCHPGAKDMSLKDEKEYHLIEEGLKFNVTKGRWCSTYPWLKPPEQLPNNRSMAIATIEGRREAAFQKQGKGAALHRPD